MPKLLSLVFICSVFCALMSGCAGNEGRPRTQTITIAGSTTILPILESWSKIFQSRGGIRLNVQGGGSTNGINLAMHDQADFGASSRDLRDSEKETLEIIPFAKDALAIIVNKSNPVDTISLEQLQKIYSGEITNWQDLGGEDKPLKFINRESGSGTFSCFNKLVMCPKDDEQCVYMSLKAIVLNSNVEMKKSVELIDNSIGYVSYGFLDDTVKPISIDGIPLSLDNIYNRSYSLARDLYLVRNKQNKREVADFFQREVFTELFQDDILKQGFIPIVATTSSK